MASPPHLSKTIALYQKDGSLTTHTTTLSSLDPLSTFPEETQSLFKAVPEDAGEAFLLTSPSTIFHAQGGGQPSDTGTITLKDNEGKETQYTVHQVRKDSPSNAILHLVTPVSPPTSQIKPTPDTPCEQAIDVAKRTLHSRLHTGGHALGLAITLLSRSGVLPSALKDGKASHYPNGAAFVECVNTDGKAVITGDKKDAIQAKVDELVKQDHHVGIEVLGWEEAGRRCIGGVDGVAVGEEDEEGVRVVEIGGLGCYACGGTHVGRLGELGRVVVRSIKRQKGVSKVGYDVVDG